MCGISFWHTSIRGSTAPFRCVCGSMDECTSSRGGPESARQLATACALALMAKDCLRIMGWYRRYGLYIVRSSLKPKLLLPERCSHPHRPMGQELAFSSNTPCISTRRQSKSIAALIPFPRREEHLGRHFHQHASTRSGDVTGGERLQKAKNRRRGISSVLTPKRF